MLDVCILFMPSNSNIIWMKMDCYLDLFKENYDAVIVMTTSNM